MNTFKLIMGTIVAILLSCINIYASQPEAVVSDANIGGHVIDVETGEHMPYYLVKYSTHSLPLLPTAPDIIYSAISLRANTLSRPHS